MKVAIVYLCILSYYLFRVVAIESEPKRTDALGECVCGLFNATRNATGSAGPVLSHAVFPRGCDERGVQECRELCVNLAQLLKETGPSLLCDKLGHIDRFKASVFTRSCGKDWLYAGMECDHELCCHDKRHVDCETGKEIALKPTPTVKP